MKEKKDCKIVQDLLPNYIDKLTSKETNTYIEEHINECKECKKILDAMKNEILVEDKKGEKKKIKYIKKYNHKLRILKMSLLSIILIIVVLFIAFPGRNMMIIASLQNKFKDYEQQSDNVYIKTSYYPSQTVATYDNYYKDGIEKHVMTYLEDNVKSMQYIYPNQNRTFVDGPDYKNLYIMDGQYLYNPLNNYTYYDSIKTLFIMSRSYKITTGKVNGKDCYILKTAYKEEIPALEFYIEKNTGLVLQTIQSVSVNGEDRGIITIQYEYSFGTVTDEDMQEPDETEYTLVEDNQ